MEARRAGGRQKRLGFGADAACPMGPHPQPPPLREAPDEIQMTPPLRQRAESASKKSRRESPVTFVLYGPGKSGVRDLDTHAAQPSSAPLRAVSSVNFSSSSQRLTSIFFTLLFRSCHFTRFFGGNHATHSNPGRRDAAWHRGKSPSGVGRAGPRHGIRRARIRRGLRASAGGRCGHRQPGNRDLHRLRWHGTDRDLEPGADDRGAGVQPHAHRFAVPDRGTRRNGVLPAHAEQHR